LHVKLSVLSSHTGPTRSSAPRTSLRESGHAFAYDNEHNQLC